MIIDRFNIIYNNELVGKIVSIDEKKIKLEVINDNYIIKMVSLLKEIWGTRVVLIRKQFIRKPLTFLYCPDWTIFDNNSDIIADIDYVDYSKGIVKVSIYNDDYKDAVIDFLKIIYKGFEIIT